MSTIYTIYIHINFSLSFRIKLNVQIKYNKIQYDTIPNTIYNWMSFEHLCAIMRDAISRHDNFMCSSQPSADPYRTLHTILYQILHKKRCYAMWSNVYGGCQRQFATFDFFVRSYLIQFIEIKWNDDWS